MYLVFVISNLFNIIEITTYNIMEQRPIEAKKTNGKQETKCSKIHSPQKNQQPNQQASETGQPTPDTTNEKRNKPTATSDNQVP